VRGSGTRTRTGRRGPPPARPAGGTAPRTPRNVESASRTGRDADERAVRGGIARQHDVVVGVHDQGRRPDTGLDGNVRPGEAAFDHALESLVVDVGLVDQERRASASCRRKSESPVRTEGRSSQN
jgi:hypothetical protein